MLIVHVDGNSFKFMKYAPSSWQYKKASSFVYKFKTNLSVALM